MQIPGLVLHVDTGNVPWRPTEVPGVRWLLLEEEGAPSRGGEGTRREASVLIEMDPGCGYPAHRHVDVEEVLILRGGYTDEFGSYGPGEHLRYEAGSVHAPVAQGDPQLPPGPENPSCVLFASARAGIDLV